MNVVNASAVPRYACYYRNKGTCCYSFFLGNTIVSDTSNIWEYYQKVYYSYSLLNNLNYYDKTIPMTI